MKNMKIWVGNCARFSSILRELITPRAYSYAMGKVISSARAINRRYTSCTRSRNASAHLRKVYFSQPTRLYWHNDCVIIHWVYNVVEYFSSMVKAIPKARALAYEI